MSKIILRMVVAGVLFVAGMAEAKTMKVEWLLRSGVARKGELHGRDGDWIILKRPQDQKPVRVGASTITKLAFKVDLDLERASGMLQDLEYEQVIDSLEKALKPFAKYSDIPSNLTKYNFLLMEAYYRTGQYDKTLTLAKGISEDDRDPALQEKSRVFYALSLIDGKKLAEAEALVAKFGWNEDLSSEAPPVNLYISAKLLAAKKQYGEAMQLVARVIAFNSQDPNWMQPSEMLCAEIYTELGLYDSGEEVCREIELLYRNSPEFDKAVGLRIKIEELRAEERRKESLLTK